MPRGYVVTTYRGVSDPVKFAAYVRLAGPAIESAGGRFLTRGMASRAMEAGLLERTVLIEFASVAAASAAYDSPAYREALRALDGGAERDVRVVEGV